ncbi:hypothetical protein AA313_de0205686 [Arthrobotrys entomopaga]|nr:hypothetical protein AA313_de0205686 [Arthrobotrys entomopaga]
MDAKGTLSFIRCEPQGYAAGPHTYQCTYQVDPMFRRPKDLMFCDRILFPQQFDEMPKLEGWYCGDAAERLCEISCGIEKHGNGRVHIDTKKKEEDLWTVYCMSHPPSVYLPFCNLLLQLSLFFFSLERAISRPIGDHRQVPTLRNSNLNSSGP